MNQDIRLKRASSLMAVLGVCMMMVCPIGYDGQVMASDREEQVEELMEGGQEDEISSRGLRRQNPKSTTKRSRMMKKVSPATQKPSGGSNQQIQALQKQVNVLQAQLNMLRAVIRVSNGVATFTSRVIRLQGDTVSVKSLKEEVTIESKKNLKLESKKDMTIKTSLQMQIDAGNTLRMQGSGSTNIRGGVVKLNGGNKPVASLGGNTMSSPGGGPGRITSGSPTVMVP